jgi:hypothetical protein
LVLALGLAWTALAAVAGSNLPEPLAIFFSIWLLLAAGGLKRLAGFCASQAGNFGNFRNFWRCCVDFGRSFSVACPRLTELNCQR